MTIYKQQMTFDDLADSEYREFTNKFKPRKTTDDCYTPENVYSVIRDWACAEYGIDPAAIVRPFWPGGDFESFDYPDGCLVLDNPPFSILAKIVRFYMAHRIRFFLFAPGLTTFSTTGCNYVCTGFSITYANGAKVSTSFVTSEGDFLVVSAPDLYQAIKEADDANVKAMTKHLPKYTMPDGVINPARVNYLSIHGTRYAVRRESAYFIRRLDANKEKGLFGGGFLLSERAAAERAAAERAAAERVAAERAAAERAAAERANAIILQLSPREIEMQKKLR